MKDIKSEQSRTNAEKTHKLNSGKGDQTIKRVSIEDSPFHVITIEGESFGVMGDYRLTKKSKSEKEIIMELSKITWNRIVQVVMLLDEVKSKINNKVNKEI